MTEKTILSMHHAEYGESIAHAIERCLHLDPKTRTYAAAYARAARPLLLRVDELVLERGRLQRRLDELEPRRETGWERTNESDARDAARREATTSTPLTSLAEITMAHVRYVLTAVDGNKSRAARILGVDRRTLYRMIERGSGHPRIPRRE